MNIGAKLARPDAVVFGGGVHDGATGQEGLEVQAEVALGGNLAPAVFGPVEGGGHQLDGGGVHNVNEAFETEGELGTAVAAEGRLQGLQMIQHGPEELLGHFRVAGAVGVGQRVFRRCGGRAQRRQRTRVKPQRVADVVEAEAVSKHKGRRTKLLEQESAELQQEAEKLADEIKELSGEAADKIV